MDANPEDLRLINSLLREIDNASSLAAEFANRLVSTLNALNLRQFNNLAQTFALFAGAAVILIIVTISVGAQTSRAINRLQAAASAFAAGNLKIRAETCALEEIKQVAMVFNTMAGRLDDLIISSETRADEAHHMR